MKHLGTDKIIDLWTSEKIKLGSPATLDQIKVTEEILSFKFPYDFIEFYLKLSPRFVSSQTEKLISVNC